MPAATLQPTGIGTLAYPFYVIEFARDQKPAPTEANATLFVLQTRETFVWAGGNWHLFSQPVTAIDVGIQFDIASSLRQIVRELRLTRRGMIDATTCKEYAGAGEDLDYEN